MNMNVAPSLNTTTTTPVYTDAQTAAAADAAAALAALQGGPADLEALTDTQLRALAGKLSNLNAGLTTLTTELGSTAISLPKVAAPTDMGALSTADLLQLIRDEARKTTAMLTVATMEAIKAQQATIALKRDENNAASTDCIAKQKEAEELAKKMEALKWVMYALGGLAIIILAAAAVVTGGATLAVAAVVMAVMMTATTCLTEIKTDEDGNIDNENGTSTMERGMKDMAESCTDTFFGDQKATDPEGAAQNGQITAVSIMAALQLLIAIVAIVATLGAAAPAVASTAASTAGSAAVSTAVTAATTAAETAAVTAKTVADVTAMAAKAAAMVQILQGLTGMAQAGGNLAVADLQYDADMANVTVTQLKALIKMLEQLLEGDMEFIKMLQEIQAQLDSGCAEIVASETESNTKTDLHQAMA